MAELTTDVLVDGRYRVLERIGSGGMADVFCAEDTHLNRTVALKVLHGRFAQDPQFVERFRREASAAAGLQHPHVVSVFDRGDHEGTYYIAMEHLEGRTLKQVVSADAPMPQERAIDFGVQILEAAGFAHRHGVVHRDFKPHNVIVDEKDGVKVTDFGIARAGASEMTETGSILGTAQYLSPEQAQGHSVDERSDLYSIGVVMYEMLTGRLPFEGDSAVAIAVKHLNEPPPRIATLRPDIHPGLEAAVMRALVKDPAKRWASADDFIAALQAARAAIAMGADGQGTAIWGPLPPEEAFVGGEEPEEGRRRRRWLLLLVPLILLGAAAFFLLRGPSQLPVADVVGDPLAEAQPQLEAAGFRVELEREPDDAPINEVLAQDPGAGVELDEGSLVTLTISNGPPLQKIPDVIGDPEDAAIKKLSKAGFKVDASATQPSDTVAAGLVAKMLPSAGTERRKGSTIQLFVSSGPRRAEVPSVVGATRSAATSELREAGFTVSVTQRSSSEPEDQVIAQDPSAGATADDGSTVTLTVSSGAARERAPAAREPKQREEDARVPDVTGLEPGAAASELRAAGFSVSRSDEPTEEEDEDGVVIRQSPGGGSMLQSGGSVTIVVGRFEEPADEKPQDGKPQPDKSNSSSKG